MTGGRRGKVGGTQGRLPLLSLLFLFLLFTTAAAKIVESLWDGFGYYYKIYGYAMNNSADYQLIQVNNSCECRRRCQVVPGCSSVSVVTLAGSDRAECRFSTRPTPLSNANDRPKLSLFPASFHFLFTDSTLWKRVEDDGFTYSPTGNVFQWGSTAPWCYKIVTITTLDQMRIIMKTTLKNTPYYVDLYRGSNSQPTWNHQGAAIPYNQTELDPACIFDNVPLSFPSKFYLQHNGSQYTFIGGFGTMPYTVLCQLNPLNLVQ